MKSIGLLASEVKNISVERIDVYEYTVYGKVENVKNGMTSSK